MQSFHSVLAARAQEENAGLKDAATKMEKASVALALFLHAMRGNTDAQL